jgi:hypothetical protein
MAKSEETRYFAQGPTDGWPGFECYGNISIGVGVIGSKCGVFRQSEDYAGKFSSLQIRQVRGLVRAFTAEA